MVGVGLLARPAMAALAVNAYAVRSLRSCSAASAGLPGGEPEPRTAVLYAAAARCSGETAAQWAGYNLAFAGPIERIGLVRAAAGPDALLAQALIAARPAYAGGYFWLAEIHRADGEALPAIDAYRRGLELDPSSGDDWLALGMLYAGLGDMDNALYAYDQACTYGDRGKNGCPNAAGLYFARGEFEAALVRYERTVQQLPDWPPGLRGLAETLIALGREQEAVPYLALLAAGGDVEAAEKLETIGGPQP